jgi:hypothetical protein
MSNKPDCYDCKGRGSIPGDCHSSCFQREARVVGNPVGIRGGWFNWPWNFDPTWLVSCDSFVSKSGKSAAVKEESPATSCNT